MRLFSHRWYLPNLFIYGVGLTYNCFYGSFIPQKRGSRDRSRRKGLFALFMTSMISNLHQDISNQIELLFNSWGALFIVCLATFIGATRRTHHGGKKSTIDLPRFPYYLQDVGTRHPNFCLILLWTWVLISFIFTKYQFGCKLLTWF